MRTKIIFLSAMITVFLIAGILLVSWRHIGPEKIIIAKTVIVPQDYFIYVIDLKSNKIIKYSPPVELEEDYYDNLDSQVLYSTFGFSDASTNESKILSYDYVSGKSKLFYSLNKKIFKIYHTIYSNKANQLLILYEANNALYFDLVNINFRQTTQHIKTSLSEKISFFDVYRNLILLSVNSSQYYVGYYTPSFTEKDLKIYLLDLRDKTIRPIDVLGYNAIFNPSNPDEILAMGADKKLFSYNIKNKQKHYFGIKCIYIRWITGTNSLLVVKPVFGDNFADVGVFDVVTKKYTRIAGGWSAIYQAFYE